MKQKMTDEMFEKASKLKDNIGTMLSESELELGIILPVLVAITCEAAIIQAEMKPHEFIASVTRGVGAMLDIVEQADEATEDDEPTDGRNNLQWLH